MRTSFASVLFNNSLPALALGFGAYMLITSGGGLGGDSVPERVIDRAKDTYTISPGPSEGSDVGSIIKRSAFPLNVLDFIFN